MIKGWTPDSWLLLIFDLIFGVRRIKTTITQRQFVYGLRTKNGKRFYYIGKTNNPKQRLTAHKASAKKRTHKNKKLQQWLRRNYNNVVLEILYVTSDLDIDRLEKRTINNYLRKKHPLTNIRLRK